MGLCDLRHRPHRLRAGDAPLAFLDEHLLVPDQNLFEGVEFSIGLLVVTSVTAVVLAPILEELFFRGVLQRSLQSIAPTTVALALTSLTFGFAHLRPDLGSANVGIVLATGTAGAVFGIATHVTKRLGPSAVAHALFNVIPVALAWALS